jgi:histidinol-phosphate/aromatic aminotransferase/cobyric acid decarboxylase-like protein
MCAKPGKIVVKPDPTFANIDRIAVMALRPRSFVQTAGRSDPIDARLLAIDGSSDRIIAIYVATGATSAATAVTRDTDEMDEGKRKCNAERTTLCVALNLLPFSTVTLFYP